MAILHILIVWFVAPFMCGTVHQPGYVQNESPPEHGRHEKGVSPWLSPTVHWDHGRNDKTEDWHQKQIISVKINRKIKISDRSIVHLWYILTCAERLVRDRLVDQICPLLFLFLWHLHAFCTAASQRARKRNLCKWKSVKAAIVRFQVVILSIAI